MNDYMNGSTSETPSTTEIAAPNLQATAQEFNKSVEDVAGRLTSAAEQFISLTSGFVSAGERLEHTVDEHRRLEAESRNAVVEARNAANDARKAVADAEEVRSSIEKVKKDVEASYGELTLLIYDLQERIAALSTLARPLPGGLKAPEAEQSSESLSQVSQSGWTPDSIQQG